MRKRDVVRSPIWILIAALIGLTNPFVHAITNDLPMNSTDDFPMERGAIWIYSNNVEVALADVSEGEDGNPVYHFKTNTFGPRSLKKEGEQFFEVRGKGQRLLYDFSAQTGSSWIIEPIEGDPDPMLDGAKVVVTSKEEEVTVPMGTFEKVVHFSFTPPPNLADAGLLEQWFAPGVGCVKFVLQSIQGPVTYEMMRIFMPGVIEPDPSPNVEIEVITDKDVYLLDETVEIIVVAKNTAEKDLTLNFSSALQANYSINRAYYWSWGMYLEPGKSIRGRSFISLVIGSKVLRMAL